MPCYVKVTFFSGTSLRPVPAGSTPKSKGNLIAKLVASVPQR
jgi:hypothetical protein